MPREKVDVLTTMRLVIPKFSSGAVCEFLQIKPWQLNALMKYSANELRPTGKVGRGKGTRHYFKTEDVYRLGVALQLKQDGFTASMVAEVLASLESDDFHRWDSRGETPSAVIALRRKGLNRKVDKFSKANAPKVEVDGETYYLLDIGPIVLRIDRAIQKANNRYRLNIPGLEEIEGCWR